MVQVSFGQDELGNGLSLGDAQSLAQEIYEYVGDESSFLEVENLYTDEILNGYVTVSQSADTYRGKFETVIDDWIYTNGRAAGDKVILESENAFYVVYIVSESANPEWFDRVNSFIRMNNYQAYKLSTLMSSSQLDLLKFKMFHKATIGCPFFFEKDSYR